MKKRGLYQSIPRIDKHKKYLWSIKRKFVLTKSLFLRKSLRDLWWNFRHFRFLWCFFFLFFYLLILYFLQHGWE
ncbi:unnamed protein product [Arabidopsis halleri]